MPAGLAFASLSLVSSAEAADFTVGNLNDSGPGSLRSALLSADSSPEADRILFQSGLSGTVNLASSLPAVDGSVEILGPGPSNLAINGSREHHMLDIEGTSTVSGLTLTRAKNDRICVDGYYDYYDEYICDEYVTSGSALRIGPRSSVTVRDMAFVGNVSYSGVSPAIESGVYYYSASDYSSLVVERSTFQDNRSYSRSYSTGGAVSATGPLTITGSTFSGNDSGGRGGAVSHLGSSGGLIGDIVISDTTFSRNRSREGGGGAVFIRAQRNVSIANSTFTDNEAAYSGGAVQIGSGSRPVTVSGCTFSGNRSVAGGNGGALSLDSDGAASVTNSTFNGNAAFVGSGGAVAVSRAQAVLDSLTVVGNRASGRPNQPSGGGIFQSNFTSFLTNSIVTGNSGLDAPDLGGGPAFTYYERTYPGGEIQTAFSLIGSSLGTAFRDRVSGSNLVGVDPRLGGLGSNGGPTSTMLPASDSPVINAGGSGLTTDQRGLTRPIAYIGVPFSRAPGGNGADMGAVEVQFPPPRVQFGKVRYTKSKGTASVDVTLNVPGTLRVSGSGVAGAKRLVGPSGQVKMTVKAKGKAAKSLKKKRKVKVKATFTLSSAYGTAKASKAFRLSIKGKKGKKRR